MRRLRKFLCVIILLSIVFSSGQVQAKSKYIVNKYTKDGIDVQIASPDEDGYIMNYIRNKNKYSVALELKGYRNFPLFINSCKLLIEPPYSKPVYSVSLIFSPMSIV